MENRIFVLLFLLEIIIITTNVYDGVKNTTILKETVESILDMGNPDRNEEETIRYVYVPVNLMDKFSDKIKTEDSYHTGLTLHNEILIDMCKYTNYQDNSYISSHIKKVLEQE